MIETVKEHCAHPDCMYRVKIGKGDPICSYAEREHRLRGCDISKCDKYKPGKWRYQIRVK